MRIVINSRRPAPSAPAGRHGGIALANLQAVLDSAPNAGRKGQAQWHTPPDWGFALSLALPAYRPILVDLTCGNGQLLAGTAAPGTNHRLGCDIEALPPDPDQLMSASFAARFIQADVTLLAALLRKADWNADCFVLNYPFDHHHYRERLAFLADSDCPAVGAAFARADGRTSADTIDSSVGGLCLALDRCSPYGEGLQIANNATVQRLIFDRNAPHAALAAHIWARVVIKGNICAATYDPDDGFETAVLYFARSHTGGVNRELLVGSLAEARLRLAELGKSRVAVRAGPVIRTYEGGHTEDTASLWEAIGLEWRTAQGLNRPGDRRWNIWLDADGTIGTNLTPFQEASEPVKKQQYVRLHALKGRHPMQLILQKAERKELEKAVFGDLWRVAPAVVDAVRDALAEYNAVRSPLYPLSKIQRLGYLDDNDDILCLKDLWTGYSRGTVNTETISQSELARRGMFGPRFRAGQRYSIRTETISVKRSGQKMNLTGELDDVEWEGSELALFIKDSEGIEQLFMEERLRAPEIRLSIQAVNAPSPIEYNLQQLVEYFEIPEVPDVATTQPQAYARNLNLLQQIEAIINHN